MLTAPAPQDALALGWSILPVGLNKRPLIASWKPYQQRRPTGDELVAWSELHPAGWALITGAVSGRITLDFDGESGRNTLQELGLLPHRRTPSGGYHVDFRHPGWKVSTLNHKATRELGQRWPGMDIKGDGGYAVFSGRTTTGEYQWLRDITPNEMETLPIDLIEYLRGPSATAGQLTVVCKPRDGRVDCKRLMSLAVDHAKYEGRNNAGFWLAVQLRDNGYAQNETELVLRSFQQCVPATNTKGSLESYTVEEAVASVRQAFQSPPREPWSQRARLTSCGNDQLEISSDWRERLLVNKQGFPRPILANAITALKCAPEWHGVLGFNEFSLTIALLKPPPWNPHQRERSEWSDQEDRLTADWFQHQEIVVSTEIAGQAVQTVAQGLLFHPVRDFLDGLRWDGSPRIETWLSRYLGADSTPFTNAVGERWLISAAARIYRPGVKADCCMILEGPQGQKKSTALKILGGKWFTDEIAELGSKDAAMQTHGVWIIEIAELDSMSRGEVSKIKAFMSRSMDRFRPPYGKRVIESPRQCVFAGSVNHSTYLRDETGGRRFWPVACAQICIEELQRDRDQLWAEAVEKYKAGAPWWLDSVELNEAASEEQAARYEGDPWDGLVTHWIAGQADVSIEEILGQCIDKPKAHWTQPDKNRVARSLRAIGWQRFKKRIGTSTEWRYRPPADKNL